MRIQSSLFAPSFAFLVHHSFPRAAWRSLVLVLVISLVLGACSIPGPDATPAASPVPTATPLPESMVTFRVEVPGTIPAGDSVNLEVLDEVTGLALNPKTFRMKAEDPQHFVVILPLAVHSVVKYRYVRRGSSMAQEHISDGRAVRYRLFLVEGPGMVQDVVSRWTDTNFSGPTGRISGQVTDTNSGAPLPNILVASGGAQTFSASDGTYLLDGLPPGTHNIVAYALDGSYQTYQQGAVVAAESSTPAPLRLTPAKFVNIVFTLAVPKGTLPAVPIRMAGNLIQLGNTFADLAGGINTLASKMPVLNPLPDGRYTVTLSLPAGADIRYKYTLGDGIWNAEHEAGGGFRLRQLIVPNSNALIEDQVDSWKSGNSAPITFDIQVPADTPAGDSVSIQFNPSYGWTEPLPMWPVGANRWIFVLYSPLDTLGAIRYRYCRNEQCGSADDSKTAGPNAQGMSVNTSLIAETIDDPVQSWAWLQPASKPTTVPNVTVVTRGSSFLAGVELQPYYHPSWQSRFSTAFKDIQSLSANWVVLTPVWTFTRSNLPVLEPLAGRDPLWSDSIVMIREARSLNMNVALFPTPFFPAGADNWWKAASRDFAWWNVWFERYRNFLLNYADMATREGVQTVIIGGDWAGPALAGGTLVDGSLSNVPQDAPDRWNALIADVRGRFKGNLAWALPYKPSLKNTPAFLSKVDQVYLLWSGPLASAANASEADMAAAAARLLDQDVKPFQEQLGKPVTLALSYPSAAGGSAGCLPTAQKGQCLSLDALSRPNADLPEVNLDLQDQAKAYNAMLLAVNDRTWISGVVSRGYYPPAVLTDKSTSIHGKPASGILWYWFPRLLGEATP